MPLQLGPIQTVMNSSCKKNLGTVFFLHGYGDTGASIFRDLKSILGDFALPHIKFVFPTAPEQIYTPRNKKKCVVWFDNYKECPDVSEHQQSLNEIGKTMKQLIFAEVKEGTSLNKMIVGGFGMGGGLALNIGYRFVPGLAGVFALSSYLNYDSGVYQTLCDSSSIPPLLMAHGNRDCIVPLDWGRQTFEKLECLNVKGELITIDAAHELETHELTRLMSWIKFLIPEKYKYPDK